MPSGAGCLLRWNDYVSPSEAHPLQKAFRGTLLFEVNFTGWGYPCQKYLRGRLGNLVKFTFRGEPLQRASTCTTIPAHKWQGKHLRESPAGPSSPFLYPGVLRRQQTHGKNHQQRHPDCQQVLPHIFPYGGFSGLQEGHAHLLRAEQHLCFQEDLHRSVCLCRADLLLDRRGFLLLTEIPLAGDGHRRLSGNPLRSSNRSISSDFPSTTFTHRFSALIQ